MSLFQTSVLKKYLNDLNQEIVNAKYQEFIHYFGNTEIQQNIYDSKEEEFQEGFIRELFVKIFGYTLKPNSNYNIVLEKKNVDNSKKADGAIIKDNRVIAVIELKSTQTPNLDTVELQAFNYKNHHTHCKYVIISNFEKIRIYIEDATDHIEFDLFHLPKEKFEILWLYFNKENILNDIPLKIKEASVLQEEDVTKKLYADYSTFRTEIYNNIVKNNTEYDKLILFKKTQKLLDRFLFIFFAEDRLLLPPNSISEIVKQWTELKENYDEYFPLYERFKKYFGYLNTGHKGKHHNIFAYNGGLFKPDEVLDNIKIDDEILKEHTVQLSKYNFETDVDVNILGHIFEHSLGEIENIQAEIEGEQVNNQKTKRKKDGIYYTPKYITKYIVDNTIGKLCDEKRKEFGIVDEEYAKGRKNRKKDIVKNLDDKLTQYREWLLQITIIDPACGSGAFLNQALEFLINEHTKIDELKAQLLGGSIVFQDVESRILENNIYGVDLNEESVEIAKLSLWLRTAQKGRKLTTLSNHIKCGNSLIDDPEIAGEKAFNWEQEFPEVFAKGGFDVVIGNPPYVRVQQLEYQVIDYLKENYKTAFKRIDISLCFIELSKKLIKKEDGIASFITSNQFLTTEYGQAMRTFLLNEYHLTECVDFGDLSVFEDALTYVSIFTFKNKNIGKFNYYHVDNLLNAMSNNYGLPQVIEIEKLTDESWNLKDIKLYDTFKKLSLNSTELGKIGNAWAGLFTGMDKIMMFSRDELKALDIEDEILLPVIRANNCSKYYCSEPEKFVIYPYKYENNKTVVLDEQELESKYPKAYDYLIKNKQELSSRKDSRKTFANRKDWYALTRFGQKNIFDKEKIVSPGEVKEHKFCLDTTKSGFSCARVFAITIDNEAFNINYVLCLLNSNLIKSFLQSFSSLKNGGFYSYSSNVLNKTPLKKISKEQQELFVNYSNRMLRLNTELNEKKNKFINRLFDNLNIEKTTKKIELFYELDFKTFLKELKKLKINLTLVQQDEWEEYFNLYKDEINQLQSEINKTDQEIDQMVYELYGLTEEEIKVVEGSL